MLEFLEPRFPNIDFDASAVGLWDLENGRAISKKLYDLTEEDVVNGVNIWIHGFSKGGWDKLSYSSIKRITGDATKISDTPEYLQAVSLTKNEDETDSEFALRQRAEYSKIKPFIAIDWKGVSSDNAARACRDLVDFLYDRFFSTGMFEKPMTIMAYSIGNYGINPLLDELKRKNISLNTVTVIMRKVPIHFKSVTSSVDNIVVNDEVYHELSRGICIDEVSKGGRMKDPFHPSLRTTLFLMKQAAELHLLRYNEVLADRFVEKSIRKNSGSKPTVEQIIERHRLYKLANLLKPKINEITEQNRVIQDDRFHTTDIANALVSFSRDFLRININDYLKTNSEEDFVNSFVKGNNHIDMILINAFAERQNRLESSRAVAVS